MKKILIALAAAAMMFSSCETEEQLGPAALKVLPESMDLALDGETQTLNLKATRDWTVTLEGENVEGITVTPMEGKGSNEPITSTVEAAKNEASNRTVKLVFKASLLEATCTLTQPGVLGNQMSIAAALASPAETEVTVKGLVVATNTNSVVITDGTDNALVYYGNDATAIGAEKVGDMVKVEGKIGAYGDLPQILVTASTENPPVTVESSGNAVTHAAPVEITAENIAGMDITKCYNLKMTGVYKVSGNYHNVEIDGTSVKGSISKPNGQALTDLTASEGHVVELSGYFVGGNNANFRNILVYNVVDKGEPQIEYETITLPALYEKGEAVPVSISGTVMAVSKKAFVVGDPEGNAVYVYENKMPTVQIGNVVTVKGKTSVYQDMKQIAPDNIAVTSAETTSPTYPAAKDANALLDTWPVGNKVELISVSGVFSDSNLITVTGQEYKARIDNGIENLSSLNGAQVTVVGYSLSKSAQYKNVSIILVSYEAAPYLIVADASADASATEATIEVKTNQTSWDFTKTEGDWATAVKSEDGNSIKVTFAANEGAERTAKFTVTAGELTKDVILTQAAKPADGSVTITISFAGGSATNQDPITFNQAPIKAEFTQGTHASTKPRWDSNCVRFYATNGGSNLLTISGATITKLEFVMNGSYTMDTVTASTGSLSGTIWTGSATEVSFVTTAQTRFEAVKVTYVQQ